MSSSPTKDAEKGAAVAADEVELARMGYKQELKFVHACGATSCADIFPFSQTRAQSYAGTVTLNLYKSSFFMNHSSELRCLILHYQYHDWHTFAVPLRFGMSSPSHKPPGAR